MFPIFYMLFNNKIGCVQCSLSRHFQIDTVKLWYCFAPGYHTVRMSSRLMSTGNHERQKKKEDVGTATVNSKTQVKTDYFKVPAGKQPFQVLDRFVSTFYRLCDELAACHRWTPVSIPPLAMSSRKRLRDRRACRNCADCLCWCLVTYNLTTNSASDEPE